MFPGPLRASVTIPDGLTVADVEYYVHNSSGSTIAADAYIFTPGEGVITNLGASAAVPSGVGISTTRVTVPTAAQGPYPTGSTVVISITTPEDGLVQINGARIGFEGYDTGWLAMTLGSGCEAYGLAAPMARRIGRIVYLRGGVQGTNNGNIVNGVLAYLPPGIPGAPGVHFCMVGGVDVASALNVQISQSNIQSRWGSATFRWAMFNGISYLLD